MAGPSGALALPPALRRILVIEGGAIDPGRDAGDRATVDLMDALVSMGGSVRLLPLGVKGRGDAIELAALDRGASARMPPMRMSWLRSWFASRSTW